MAKRYRHINYSKIDRESECEQLLKKIMAKSVKVKNKNDGTLMEKIFTSSDSLAFDHSITGKIFL